MTPLTEALFEQLRARILSGELPAGTRLPPERELAREYGTNRNTLREAVRRLEQARLVTVRQGQGVTVADFRLVGTIELLGPFLEDSRDAGERARVLLDLLEPRAKVIDFLVEIAGRNAEADDRARLHDVAQEVARAEAARDTAAYISAQSTYLNALVTATHSVPMRWLANPVLEATRDMLGRLRGFMLFEPSFAAMAHAINAALDRDDVDGARAACASFHASVDALLRPLFEASLNT